MTVPNINAEQIAAFHRDGVVFIPGLLTDWVAPIRDGIDRVLRDPGPYASDYQSLELAGRFFDSFLCWPRVPEFIEALTRSPLAETAAALMRSKTSQLFHDHVLVKEPGTSMPTPWHQDATYFFLDGMQ